MANVENNGDKLLLNKNVDETSNKNFQTKISLDILPENVDQNRIKEEKEKGEASKQSENLDTLNLNFSQQKENVEKFAKEEPTISPQIRQLYLGLGPILLQVSMGTGLGYSTILFNQKGKDLDFDFLAVPTVAFTTWIIILLGCILSGLVMELIGRKAILMVTSVPFIIGWLLIYFFGTSGMIIVGTILINGAAGLTAAPSAVYVAETSCPKSRSLMLGLLTVGFLLGGSIVHALGYCKAWREAALICCIFPTLSLLSLIPVPESPTFLAKKSLSRAKTAFYWCRGHDDQTERELKELLDRQTAITLARRKTWLEYILELREPQFLKPLLITLLLSLTSHWCGDTTVYYYSNVMAEMAGIKLNPDQAQVWFDLVRLFGSTLSCILVVYIGCRPLVVLSGFGTSFSLCMLFFTIFFNSTFPLFSAIAFISGILCLAFISIGLMPLSRVMMGEVFPLANRGLGNGLASLLYYLSIWSVISAEPTLFLYLHFQGIFVIYTLFCLTGTVLLMKFMPETRNKPLYWIEDYFKGKIPNTYY